ncbi:unnamed protein product [Adineta steineri]|uniref:Uncharacterized protein n=1 Tax=Adineta steineri TaxID=433720 RepID=A0A815HL76_9BILA|nr:unnamed protein product [Adineta steineri]
MPSALTKLKINVPTLIECVCLSTLTVNVLCMYLPDMLKDIDLTKKLPNLKCLSFTSLGQTYEYDKAIVPLLRRMINLEELKLYLLVRRFDSTYIDGYQLYDQFLIYMTQLKKFTFYMKTEVSFETVRFELPTNEDIQRSFIGRRYPQVTSYTCTQSVSFDGVCHIYSLPYDFEYFVDLNNSFQGGIFKKVRLLKMYDTISFEHNFFELISPDFPFLEFLYINNNYPRKDNQHSSTLIKFPYLTYLALYYTHVDYVKLFLFKQNMYLPHLLNLSIKYKSLITITKNFTNDPKYFNFDQLKSLRLDKSFVRPQNFHQYFPLL